MLVVFAGHTQEEERRGKPESEQNQSTGEKKGEDKGGT